MAERKHPTIKRDETIRSVLIGVFVLFTACVIALSDRALIIGSRSWVLPGAALPQNVGPPKFAEAIDEYGVHIPKLHHRPLFAVAARTPDADPREPTPGLENGESTQPRPLRFGYSIRELDILGMPFLPSKEYGHVLYYETPYDFAAALATEDYLKQVRIPLAKPLSAWDFPWWQHMWGWLWLISLIGIGLFELGALRRRREALGLI